MRRLIFTFLERGTTGRVALHDTLAPETCETIWQALARPIEVTAYHAIYAGPEIMVGLPPSAQTFDPRALPPENQTVIPEPGDVLWFYQAPRMMKGLTDEFWEIGCFYDGGGRVFGPLGWTPVTIFGRMLPEDLDAFADACRAIRVEGAKQLGIARA